MASSLGSTCKVVHNGEHHCGQVCLTATQVVVLVASHEGLCKGNNLWCNHGYNNMQLVQGHKGLTLCPCASCTLLLHPATTSAHAHLDPLQLLLEVTDAMVADSCIPFGLVYFTGHAHTDNTQTPHTRTHTPH